jgi:hypothetical protein
MLILDGWFGRLGNNISQISNMIDIAIYYKHNIVFNKKHSLFNLLLIENYFSKYNNSEVKVSENNFYYKNYPLEIYKKNIEERNKLLKEVFLIKDIKKLSENDLVIHIRSGDIFKNNKPHPRYIPPPLSYYTKHINKNNYNKIIILCEDRVNPVVNELLKLYKNAIHTINTLNEDIKIVLSATNIIFSVGTFIPALLKMSDNIKYVEGFDYNNKTSDKGYNVSNNEKLKDYYIIMKPWKNTEKQRDFILTYDYKL